MDYKKIIKSQDTRFKILSLLRFIPDSLMVKIQYRIKLRRKLNLKNPKRYTEKLQWYKINYRDPLMAKCADKYRVREYIHSKGLGYILNELYEVYNNENEIKLEDLPNKFVIKTTNGSGTNILCKNKNDISINEIREELKNWLKRDYYICGREWAYKDAVSKIIVEEYLEDNDNPFEGINDYKFLCFNGKPEYIVLDVDRQVNHKRNIYDLNWNLVDVSTDHDNIKTNIEKPEGLDEMIKIATVLAEDFPCVRVDLYWLNGKVYFGELTFYPWTGYVQFEPDEFDYRLGSKFNLSIYKNE